MRRSLTHERDHGPRAAPPGPYVVKKLRELDVELADAIAARRGSDDDDEAIHDLRVAIRRLRTLLKMARAALRPLAHGRGAQGVRRRHARDRRAPRRRGPRGDARGRLEAPGFATWLAARARRARRSCGAPLIARIERGDLDRARLMLKALLVFPFEPARNVELAKFARKTVERARRVVEKGRDVEVPRTC